MDSKSSCASQTPGRAGFPTIQRLENRRLFAANFYIEQDQASDGAVSAGHTDSHLVNPWGMAVHGHGIQVANADSGFTTVYDAAGNSVGPAVRIPGPGNSQGSPTGIAYNGDTTKFIVSTSAGPGSAQFLYATEQGTIDVWATANKNRKVNIVVDRSAQGASYKGIAVANVGADSFIYAANFSKGKIDVFDTHFSPATLSGTFTDPKLPAHYSPFNIQKIGSQLFVMYAKHKTNSSDETAGASTGVVDIFKPDGTFVKRFAAGKTLNAPWGIAQAPADFAAFGNDILIGNFGDGRISAFDSKTGVFQGQMNDTSGDPIAVSGLWGLAFGNGKAGTLKNGLYFTAGVEDESHGLYGRFLVDPYEGAYPGYTPQSITAQAKIHRMIDDLQQPVE